MFTWICPKCGRDVPPSYCDCPDCTPKPVKASEPEPSPAPAPVAPEPVRPAPEPERPAAAPFPPPEPLRPLANAYMNFPAQPPETRKGPPGWLIALGFAVGLAGVLYLLFTYVLPKKTETAGAAAPSTAGAAATPKGAARKAHPLVKFLEITGVRFTEDAKGKAKVQFIVVNHSAADLPELKMTIAVKAAGKTVFEFPFAVSSIGPYESKDFSAPVQTTLKGYELPDWQFLKADFELTSEP